MPVFGEVCTESTGYRGAIMVNRRLRIVALVLATASISGGWIATGFAADATALLAVPPRPMGLDAPLDQILNGTRALVVLDSRLYKLIAPGSLRGRQEMLIGLALRRRFHLAWGWRVAIQR